MRLKIRRIGAASAEHLTNAILAIAAVTVAIVVVRREFEKSTGHTQELSALDNRPAYYEGWRNIVSDGLTIGPSQAPVRIIEFADIECPACAQWHLNVLEKVLAEFGDRVAYTMVHLPLPRHKFAKQAALASECAHRDGRFFHFLHVAYEKQDSIGLKSWGDFAAAAGVADTTEFRKCAMSPEAPRVSAGIPWATRAGVKATPTVLINGWRFSGPPPFDEVSRAIRAILAGEQPY